MVLDILYYSMVAALLTHEVDAVKRHEWRVLPPTGFLPEKFGEQVFIWAHLPWFLAILHFSGSEPVNGFRIGLAIFAVVHVGLHSAYRRHPAYEFNNLSSWSLILLAGFLGAAYLLALLA